MWKLFEKGYEVSTYGEIRSLDRVVCKADGRKTRLKGITIKQQTDDCGYKRVSVSVDNVKSTLKVHRVVAGAFLDNPLNLPCVNHKDGNKANNNVDNLEWVSYSENLLHAYTHGLTQGRKGKEHPMYTGHVLAINQKGEIIAKMHGNSDMRLFGFDFRLVSAVLKGKRKTHMGCTFIKVTEEK